MPDEERKTIFSKNFNKAMKEKGIRQIDLVKDLKLNSSTVSNWSKGIMLPRSDKLKMLSTYLGVSAAKLMGWEENYDFRDVSDGEVTNLEATKKFFQQKMEKEVLSNYNKVNLEGKKKIIEYSSDIAANPKYIDEITDSEE